MRGLLRLTALPCHYGVGAGSDWPDSPNLRPEPPIFEEQPGFRAYSLATDGTEVLSFSVWESREAAEAGSAAAADWVRENMGGQIELIGTRYAEILLSTALGVHA